MILENSSVTRLKLPSTLTLSACILLASGSLMTGCLSRSFESAGSKGRVLESRPPFPGETNGRPVMDAANYEPFTRSNNAFGRDGIESESVQGVFGLSTNEIIDFTNATPNGNRTVFQRVSTPRYAEYFAIGTVDDNKVPWDAAAHAAREASPYVPLRTENERLTVNAQGNLDVTAGTDFMIDMYYDSPDFILLSNGILVRSRNRQDRPGVGRRALLQYADNCFNHVFSRIFPIVSYGEQAVNRPSRASAHSRMLTKAASKLNQVKERVFAGVRWFAQKDWQRICQIKSTECLWS